MWIRASLHTARDPERMNLNYIFIDIMLEEIDEIIFRKPEYSIRGKKRPTITIYNLSTKEAERILDKLMIEKEEGDFIETAQRFNSRTEKPPGPFLFSPPDLTEEGREEIERKKGQGIDIGRMLYLIMKTNSDVIFEYYKENMGQEPPAPWTFKAYIRYRELYYLEPPEDPEDPEYMISLYEMDAEAGYFDKSTRKPRKRAPKPPRHIPIETGTVGPGGVITNKRKKRTKTRAYKPPRQIKRKKPRPNATGNAPHQEDPTGPL